MDGGDSYNRTGGDGGGANRGARAYNDDASSSQYNPTNSGLLSGSSSSAAGGRSASDYLSRKTGEDLRLLNENLTRELEEKDEEIRQLNEISHKGVLQQKLQRALLDNKDLRKRLDEIRGYQTDTKTHLEDNAALLTELESLKGEMLRSKGDYEEIIRSLQLENEQLKDDLHKCEVKIGAYERETNELEDEIATHERSNTSLLTELQSLRNQLQDLRSGGRVSELEEKLQNCTLLLQSKESENDRLLQEMTALTDENDKLRLLQTEYVQDVQVRHTQELERSRRALEEKQDEIQHLKNEIHGQLERNRQLESFKIDHDALILELRNKMSEYEHGYNLTDAVAEIRTIKTQLKKCENDRLNDKDLINRRERDLQRYVAENRNLKQLAGIEDPNWGLNSEELELQNAIELQKLQALHRTDTKIIKKLEEDRLELLDELRKGTTDRTREGLVYLGLQAEQQKLLEEYVERLKNGDTSLPQTDQSFQLQQRCDQMTKDLEAWKERYARVQVEKDEMSSKLMTMMERDKGMAYEQILKQITDLKVQYNMAQLSQSTPLHGGVGMTIPATGAMMTAIPESPGGRNLRSPSINRAMPQTPIVVPLPTNASAELRVVADRASNLSLPERHALFVKLNAEFQPAQHQQQQQAGSRLMSPNKGGNSARGGTGGPQMFIFPTPTNAATTNAAQQGSNVPAGMDSSLLNTSIIASQHVPLEPYANGFDPSSMAMLSITPQDLINMDQSTKARLVGCLTELLSKERENNELLDGLELYQVRFEKLAARQQMLYIEYNNGKKSWLEEKESLVQKLSNVHEEKEKLDVQIAQLQSVSNPSNGAGDGVGGENEVEQLRRKNLVLSTNEKVLTRRFLSLEQQYVQQSSQLTCTQKEFIEMEHTLRLRIQELQKRKKLLEGRCMTIQELTRTWIPKEELMKIARKYNWMASQYAELIAKQDLNMIERNTVNETKRENENLKFRVQEMELELKLQIEKNQGLKDALDQVELTMIPDPNPGSRKKVTLAQKLSESQRSRLGTSSSSSNLTVPSSQQQSIPSLLAELADLKARESSSLKRCMRLDENLASINTHSLELEEELLQIRKKHHELSIAYQSEQEVVLELRNKLEGSVPHFKVNQLQQDLLELNEKLIEQRESMKHYKEIADLANHQSIQLLNLRPEDPSSGEVHEDLVKSLQDTINLLQSSSDDASQLGRLYRENMNLKLKIRTFEKDEEQRKKEMLKLEQSYQLLEKELDLKHTDLYRLHNQARTSLAEKEKIILDFTSKNSIIGNPNSLNHPMTLQQAETIHQATLKMQQQLDEAEKKQRETKEENDKYYLQVAELTIQLNAAKELASLMPAAGGVRSKPRSGRAAAAATSNLGLDHIDDDDDAPPLPASLSLTGVQTGVLDSNELNLKLRQNLINYSNELSKYKLNEVKLQHSLTTLQGKYDFQLNELHTYEQQIGKLQQDLVEKDLYITQKENSFKEQYLYLKEQETKLKLSESLKRMEVTKKNKRQQMNAIATLKRITGQENAGGVNLAHHIDEEEEYGADPFAAHGGERGAAGGSGDGVDDLDNLDVANFDIGSLTDELASSDGAQPRMIEGVLIQLQSKLRLAKQVMVDQKEKLHDLELENKRILALKDADENALHSAQEVAQLERARLLSQAQATIQNLNEQLSSKNSRIEKYQTMLEDAQTKYKQRKVLDDLEIERLNEALLQQNTQQIGKLHSAMNFLDELPRLPKDVVSRVEMEDLLKEKEGFINLLNKEIEFLKIKCQDEEEAREMIDQELKKLFRQSSEEIAGLKSELVQLEASKQDDVKMNKLITKLRSEMSEKDEAVAKLEEAMTQLKDSIMTGTSDLRKFAAASSSSTSPPTEAAKDDAGSMATSENDYKKQCTILERKLKSALASVTAEKTKAKDAIGASAVSADQVAQRDEQIRSLETSLKTKQDELDSIRLKLIQSQNETSKVRESLSKVKIRLTKELEDVKKELEKEKDLNERKAKLQAKLDGTHNATGSGQTTERAAPKEKVAHSEEKESSSHPPPSSSSSGGKSFQAWEDDKKSLKKISLLTTKLAKQTDEILGLQEGLKKLTSKLTKEQKEKLDLFQRFTGLQQQYQNLKGQMSGSSFANMDVGGIGGGGGGGGGVTDDDVPPPTELELEKALTKEALKQKIFELQSMNDALQRKLNVEVPQREAVLKEDVASALRKADTFLREKREAERLAKEAGIKLPRNRSTLVGNENAAHEATIHALESHVSSGEGKILELTLANLDLKYSAEHAGILVHRLRTRVQEMSQLLKLIDGAYLTKEWQELIPDEVKEFIASIQEGANTNSSAPTGDFKPALNQRALTLILSTFRKIFEKLKSENDSLHKNSSTSMEYMNMLKENRQMKKKLQAYAQQVVEKTDAGNKENRPTTATTSTEPTAASGGGVKDVDVNLVSRTDLERSYSLHMLTRKELKKEQDLSTRLKKKLNDVLKDLETTQQSLSDMEKRLGKTQSSEQLEWFRKEKNYLATIHDVTQEKRACEEEIRRLKVSLKELKTQMKEMTSLIEHVRAEQATTQEQVLQAAQVQAAVLTQTELEQVREQQHRKEVQTLQHEREQLKRENLALKNELSAFDGQFFEELEDLKYRYAQSVEQVQLLTQKLRQVQTQTSSSSSAAAIPPAA